MNKTTLVVLVGRKLGDAEQTLMYLIVCEQRVDALQAKTKENKKTSVRLSAFAVNHFAITNVVSANSTECFLSDA